MMKTKRFVITRMGEGSVVMDGWWLPYLGQRVYLWREGDDLIVGRWENIPIGADYVSWRWPSPRLEHISLAAVAALRRYRQATA